MNKKVWKASKAKNLFSVFRDLALESEFSEEQKGRKYLKSNHDMNEHLF